ncbi:hypothetical protein EHS13_20320 [Paenibacillus psychroresistens]|uniref:Uncharacterized protein n=1 Tax=Paenibacillus psychroresistens TaxID=1778678 RepID=A0A6B8RND8_9BACL|nr:hypothetical protein [Paenibacillus psychroresistens]QGQ97065.1 hypothetical protein EHS13_20320 [Paenibacillus psychroresistens]
MGYTAKETIIHNGEKYIAGEEVLDLRESDIARLMRLEVIEGSGEAEDQEVYKTIAEFKALKPTEQAEYLASVGLEPSENTGEYNKQYKGWYDSNR